MELSTHPYLLVNRPHCNKMSLKTYKTHKGFILIKLPRNGGEPCTDIITLDVSSPSNSDQEILKRRMKSKL